MNSISFLENLPRAGDAIKKNGDQAKTISYIENLKSPTVEKWLEKYGQDETKETISFIENIQIATKKD